MAPLLISDSSTRLLSKRRSTFSQNSKMDLKRPSFLRAATMDSMAQTGGAEYSGLGSSAVGTNGIPETGGGYNLSFVDSKGGVAVTIPGSAGTSDRTLALGKLIEERRSGKAPVPDQKDASGAHGQTADGQKAGHGQTAPNQP